MNQMNSHSPHFQKLKKKNKKEKQLNKFSERIRHCFYESGEGNSSTTNGDTRRANTKHHKRIQRMVFETRMVVGIGAVD